MQRDQHEGASVRLRDVRTRRPQQPGVFWRWDLSETHHLLWASVWRSTVFLSASTPGTEPFLHFKNFFFRKAVHRQTDKHTLCPSLPALNRCQTPTCTDQETHLCQSTAPTYTHTHTHTHAYYSCKSTYCCVKKVGVLESVVFCIMRLHQKSRKINEGCDCSNFTA